MKNKIKELLNWGQHLKIKNTNRHLFRIKCFCRYLCEERHPSAFNSVFRMAAQFSWQYTCLWIGRYAVKISVVACDRQISSGGILILHPSHYGSDWSLVRFNSGRKVEPTHVITLYHAIIVSPLESYKAMISLQRMADKRFFRD